MPGRTVSAAAGSDPRSGSPSDGLPPVERSEQASGHDPGVGPLAASALVASIGDASSFKNGRSFAAFIGLVPRQSSSGGKERLGKISKRGDHYLRWLLVVGSLALIRYAQRHGTKRPWLIKLLQRPTTKIAAVAVANKIARIAWVLMTRGDVYREPAAQAA